MGERLRRLNASGAAQTGIQCISSDEFRSGKDVSFHAVLDILPGKGPGQAFEMRDVERRAIVQALEDAKGNKSAAARALDIDRSTLRRKMREYDIADDG